MSRHLQDLLDDLKGRVSRMGAMVQQAVEQAVQAVLAHDPKLARQVVDGDRGIDEEEVRVEKAAIDLLALHQPAAGDLRYVTTVIKVNSELERIADCAVNAAQRVPPLSHDAGDEAPADLRLMSNTVLSTLRDTIRALNLGDVDLARQVMRSDDVVDALYHQIVQDVLCHIQAGQHKASSDLSYIMIAKNLERMADHCTNIAEDVVYVHTGRIIRHLHAV
ncbi:MAG TPA: phosphate signaling complex protein PhoU [Tepidisphaeraceae bacterium]|nr:phosphate signaling complex protein PhoU [Tepidisphaeraceae bacterium]